MAHMDAPRNWGVSKTGSFGLAAVIRGRLHERPLSSLRTGTDHWSLPLWDQNSRAFEAR